MNKIKRFVLFSVLTVCLGVFAQENTATWISSVDGNVWQTKAAISLQDTPAQTSDIEIFVNNRQQTFKGWGTCFNELGWDALNKTSNQDHQDIMRRFFAPDGDLKYTYCRIPIGANDYARSWYSSNEKDQDFAMEHFNVDRDKQTLIPYIKEALSENPDIDFWASPWSPPAWMKTNKHYANRSTAQNGMPANAAVPTLSANQFIQEPAYLEAYATYFSKFIDAYQAEGINISMIMYQNEAYTFNDYPNCTWLPDGTLRFNAEYLVPKLKETHPNVEVFLGTMNTNNMSVYNAILSDPRAINTFDGIGFQWEGLQAMPNIRNQYPNYRVMQTESECGSGTFNWSAGRHTFGLISQYLNHGAEAYTFWNMILKDNGTSTWGWNQNALVRVNGSNGAITYTPEYYAVKHFCNVVEPGSIILKSNQAANANMLAVRTPNGKIAVVLGNFTNNTVDRTIKIGNKHFTASLPAQSFNTFTFDAEVDENIDKSELTSKIDAALTLYGDGSGNQAANLHQTITEAQTILSSGLYQYEIDGQIAKLEKAIAYYQLYNTSGSESLDITSLIVNPNFDEGITGWYRTGSGGNFVSNGATEFWHTASTLYQTIGNLPLGKYTLKARAFVADGNQSFLFANEDEIQLPLKLSSDNSNSLSTATASLAGNNEYAISLDFSLLKNIDLKIGINSKTATLWTVFDSFELYYVGDNLNDLTAALSALIDDAQQLYDASKKGAVALQSAITEAQQTEQTSAAIVEAIESLETAMYQYQLANASADQPVDMTYLITNPSFEAGFNGWTNNGMAAATNEHMKTKNEVILKDGNVYVEKWVDTGKTVSTPLGISQTISGLPNGKFNIRAAAFSLYRNLSNMPGDDDPRTGGYLIANTTKNPVGWREEYEITATVFDNTLTIGYEVDAPAAGLNWVGCDNFRIYYCGADVEALRQSLSDMIIEAETYLDAKMNAAFLTGLNNAINDAEAAIEAIPANEEDIEQAVSALNIALKEAKQSASTYAVLKIALDEAQEKKPFYSSFGGYDAFAALCNEVNNGYVNGLYEDSEISAVIKSLKEGDVACRLTQQTPFDASFMLLNPSFEDDTYNVAPKTFIPKHWELDFVFPADKDVRLDNKTPYEGLKSYNIWADNVGKIDLYQTINLPEGSYTLKAAMRTLDKSANELLTNQHIYVIVGDQTPVKSENLSSQGVGVTNSNTWEILSAYFTVPEEGAVIRIGAASSGRGNNDWGGWFQIDDVQLVYEKQGVSSGIIDIDKADGILTHVEYFNLQGIKISKPQQHGIYIIKKYYQSGKSDTEKIVFDSSVN